MASSAFAVDNLNHSGTICKNYNAGEVTDIDYLANGTRNINANPRNIICPLVQEPTSPNDTASVFVGATHFGNQSTNCTVFSYDFDGTFLAANNINLAGAGFQGGWVNFAAGQAAFWSNLSVLCTIAGGGTAVLNDVIVTP